MLDITKTFVAVRSRNDEKGALLRQACRDTWLKTCPYVYGFFVETNEDCKVFNEQYVSFVPAPYGRDKITVKTHFILSTCLELNCNYILLTNDTTFNWFPRITEPKNEDVLGFQFPHGHLKAGPYVDDCFVWYSPRALKAIVDSKDLLNIAKPEADAYSSRALANAGVPLSHDNAIETRQTENLAAKSKLHTCRAHEPVEHYNIYKALT